MPESKSKVKISAGAKALADRQKPKITKPVTKKPEAKIVKPKEAAKASTGLKLDVYDLHGKVVEKADLPKEIFGAKVNNLLIAQAVRVFLANQRRGTVSTKTRGEVQGSSVKIYKQKGTGRARHGSKRAPIFVHGGLVFGPKPRDYSLKLPKKMKKAALFSALSLKRENNEIKILKGLDKVEPKTKVVEEVFEKLGFPKKSRKVLLVTNGVNDNIYRAVRNLAGIDFIPANLLNTYSVLDNKTIVLMKEAIVKLEEAFLKENK